MPELAKCPACGKFAAGASQWSVDQPVRCPHCLVEFVLRGAIVQSLPQLIPVGVLRSDENVVEAVGPQIVVVEVPSPQGKSTERRPAVEPSPAPEPTAGPSGVGEPDSGASSTSQSKRPVEPQPSPLPPSYAAAYDFLPLERKQQLDTAAAVAARLRGGRRRRNWFAELLKIVLGGVLGLALGYWGLNYFGGPRFDWLKIYLPGCPHTKYEVRSTK